MSEVVIAVDKEMEDQLSKLLDRFGPNGYVVKHMVAMVDGRLKVEIRANEHPPPHFHVTYDGEDASFSLTTGERLPEVCGLERYDGPIKVWWKHNRRRLAIKWNETRPGNCTVGLVPVPDEPAR